MRATTIPGRNVDAAPIFASNYNFDLNAGCDAVTFQPCSDRALASLKVIVDRFRLLYPISQNTPVTTGAPIGMYYEDQLLGGQVYFFT